MKRISEKNCIPTDTAELAIDFGIICGVDEAGRGPLAGPVVAGAVVFRDCKALQEARDSKVLSAKKREQIFEKIVAEMTYSIGFCSPAEIDEINILRASLLAMERAIADLPIEPKLILVDGPHNLTVSIPSRAVINGDSRIAVIGAASIIAKVTRDKLMREYEDQFPGYGFAKHMGYPTEAHRTALRLLGPCPIHRRSFRGVRELLA